MLFREFENHSIEDLLDIEQVLLEKRAEDEPGANNRLHHLYKILLKKIRRNKEYRYLEQYITKRFIKHLIWFGTYMKSSVEKSEKEAERYFHLALKEEPHIPIAHYRLGFLAYKRKDYVQALQHFEKAIQLNEGEVEPDYQLNEIQHYYAHLYLTNSALFIAKNAQDSIMNIKNKPFHQLPNYEISPFYEIIAFNNEEYLTQNAYTVVSKEGKRYCTKEEAENLQDTAGMLICYFGDREIAAIFNGEYVKLTNQQAELLRYLLIYGTEKHPITKFDVADIFTRKNPNFELKNNTFTKAIQRLKEKLENIHFPIGMIQNKQAGYYFADEIDYLIIHRTDEDFFLKE